MKPGRHCILCGKEGGSGMTAAIRALHESYVVAGLQSPVAGKLLTDVKAHGPCVIKAKAALVRK